MTRPISASRRVYPGGLLTAFVLLSAAVVGTAADRAPAPRPAIPPVKMADGYEIIVFAPHRPIRARVSIVYLGKSLAERWTEALRKAFDGFDRDGNGYLSGFEVQYIFSDASLAQLMQSAYYAPNPADLPTLAKLDTNHDKWVSFAEFAAYYKTSAAQAVHAFPPADENVANAQTTEALFKLFDANGDGKLTRDEVAAAEKLLATRDADEDECLTVNELLPNGANNTRGRVVPVEFTGRGAPAPRVPQNVVVYEPGGIPGTLIQRILKEYDKDKDFELSKAESGFDPATFARLDTDGNGRLSGEELDEWRTGPADLDVTLSLATKAVDCKVEVTTPAKLVAERGFSVKVVESGRVMVRHGRQPVEFWAYAPVVGRNNARGPQVRQQWVAMFQQLARSKGYVADKDFAGANAVQYQMLRVIVDPADFDGDGKLTRKELDKYFDLQQPFVDLGVALAPAVQTPTLFQLLDENRDGRLGVRELRTAWDRLFALEPLGPDGSKPAVVTHEAIQPSVSVRVSRVIDRQLITQQIGFPNGNQVAVPQKGPTWFRKMDRNGDGDVSRLEFLGTRAEFDLIDADRDGLISLDEAETHDQKTRR